jgi:hypothetical protein
MLEQMCVATSQGCELSSVFMSGTSNDGYARPAQRSVGDENFYSDHTLSDQISGKRALPLFFLCHLRRLVAMHPQKSDTLMKGKP